MVYFRALTWNTEDMDTYGPNDIFIAELGYTDGSGVDSLEEIIETTEI